MPELVAKVDEEKAAVKLANAQVEQKESAVVAAEAYKEVWWPRPKRPAAN